MKVIGLTGGIATGKSTVTRYVLEKGVPVIDCDAIARTLLQPGHQVYHQVRRHFPSCFPPPHHDLDRKALGQLIFTSGTARKTLNRLTHGYIRRKLLYLVLYHFIKRTPMVLIDAPLLIEAGLDRWMSEVVVVYCSDALHLDRLMHRDGCTIEEAEQRIRAQLPMSEKLKKATYILENNADFSSLYHQVDAMLKKFQPSSIHVLFWWCLPWVVLLLIFSLLWMKYESSTSFILKQKVHLDGRKYF